MDNFLKSASDYLTNLLGGQKLVSPVVSNASSADIGSNGAASVAGLPRTPLSSPATPPPAATRQFLESQVFPITRQYGVPDAVAAGQWAKEGGRLLDNSAHNLFGLKNSGGLIKYPSLERNIHDYGLTVKNILKTKGQDLARVKDPSLVLQGLQTGNQHYDAGPDQAEYASGVSGTPEYRYYNR
jgi:hypothetical protein